MKRIALVLVVGLSAAVVQADEFDVVDMVFFGPSILWPNGVSGDPCIRRLT